MHRTEVAVIFGAHRPAFTFPHIVPGNDPWTPQGRQTLFPFAVLIGIAPRAARVIHHHRRVLFFRAVRKPGGGLRNLAKANPDFGIKFPGNINAPAARKFVIVSGHGRVSRRTTLEKLPATVLTVSGSKGHRKTAAKAFQRGARLQKLTTGLSDSRSLRIPPDSQPEAPLR